MTRQLSRRQFIKTIAGGLLASSVAEKLIAKSNSPKPPNLIFVFPDQMRGQAMGFMKQDPVITPNLDRFAQESLVLTNAVSN